MNTKLFIVICLLAAIAGIAVGVYSYGMGSRQTVDTSGTPAQQKTPAADVQPAFTPGQVVSEGVLPSPIIAPVKSSVTSVTADMIIITGKDGEMNLPKQTPLLSVFIRKNGETIAGTFDDVKVGMSADVNVIIPGEKVNLILL